MDLKLSEAQIGSFAGWRRPLENVEGSSTSEMSYEQIDGLLMGSLDQIDLVQDITTDCSVVASLCAGTARALKGHGQVSS